MFEYVSVITDPVLPSVVRQSVPPSAEARIPQWVLDRWDGPSGDGVEELVECECPAHLLERGELDVPAFIGEWDVEQVLGLVPVGDLLRWLSTEPPSPRVVELAHALTRVPELERRAAGWPAWAAADLLSVWVRVTGWVTARTDAAVVALAGRSKRSLDDFGREEVAMAMRLAPVTAAGRLHSARERCGPLARVGAALAGGSLLATQADDLVRELRDLDGVGVDEVCDRVLPVAGEMTRGELVTATRTAVLAVDPDAAAQRHEDAKQGRGMCVVNQPDAMTDLAFRVTADEAGEVRAAVDEYARRHVGSGRTVEQLRADALVAWARDQLAAAPTTVTAHGRPLTEIHVTMTAGAFLGITDQPAILKGYGPIHAQLARDLITADARVRRLLTDPFTGSLIAMDPTIYRASQFCSDTVITRDGTCRMRGCNRSAELCDLDHTVKFREGGDTCPCNLAPLCRRHHRMKDAGGWQLLRRDGRLTWITRTGHEYHVVAHPAAPTEIPSPRFICPTGCAIHERSLPPPRALPRQPVPDDPPPPSTPRPVVEIPCPF